MIAIIEDDRGWEDYYRRLLKRDDLEFFHDGVAAINRMDEVRPDLVILDILLTGPTGFAVLHEMQSYPELASVPVIVVSSVKIEAPELTAYGVRAVFDKSEMLPQDLRKCVEEALSGSGA